MKKPPEGLFSEFSSGVLLAEVAVATPRVCGEVLRTDGVI